MKEKLFAFLFLLGCSGTAVAQQRVEIDPVVGFNKQFAEQSKLINTIKCDFTQVKQSAALVSDVIMKGKFYYDNSGLICLDYSDPQGNQIIMNGDRFAIQNAGKRNVVTSASNPMLKQLMTMLQGCMSGDLDLFNKGWKALYAKQGREYIVELTPLDKRTRKYIAQIVLNFDNKDMSLNRMSMIEVSGGCSVYEFRNKQFNMKIDHKIFEI